jgi:hypothetical protein
LAIWRLVEQVAVALQGGGIAEAVGQGAISRLFPHGAAMLQGEGIRAVHRESPVR